MKNYHVEFTSAGLVKDPIGTIAARNVDNARVYSGMIRANDPDDALYRIAEAYRGATVRKCYPVME